MDKPALFVGSARLGVSRGISRGHGGHREHHIRGDASQAGGLAGMRE